MSETGNGGRIVNRAGLAALCAVSLPTIDAWVRKDCPVLERGSAGREWQFDSAAVIEWRISTAVENAVAGYQNQSGNTSKEEADRRRAVANAISAEVAADEALHSVIYRHEAEADMAAFCQVLKTGLGNASSKIAARAAAMINAAEIEDLCHAEINRSFRAAQAELAARWSDERGADADGTGEE